MFELNHTSSTRMGLVGLVALAATLLPAPVPAARLPEPSSAPSARRFT